MLTEDQIKYLATVPDNKRMTIRPFNPKGLDIAGQIIKDIKSVEPDLEVVLMGSLALKIWGQEDIDINVFCIKSRQVNHLDNFKNLFGQPSRQGKNYIGWDFQRDGFSVDIRLTDPTSKNTIAQIEVFNLLKNNPNLLKEYEKIKKEARHSTYKEYQTRKFEFFNKVLA